MQPPSSPARIARALAASLAACLAFATTTQAQVPTIVPGFPNVAQTEGELMSGLNEPNQGRTAIIAYHNGVLYTVPELPSSQPGSDFLVRSWDLSNPASPSVTASFGVSPMPINAHGYFKSGDYLVVGSNWPPESPWSFRYDTPGTNVRTEYPDLLCAGVRGCLFGPYFVGPTFWSYGDIDPVLSTFERDWTEIASFDHLGQTGVIGHPFLVGDLLIYASDQSRTGVATWSLADPANPVLLDVLTTGGPGGYWPELWGGDGKLYVVFPYRTGGNGIRVVDVTDPADLKFVADTPLPGDAAMYAQFQDEYAFVGSHKVDMRTFQSVLDLDGANTVRTSDGGTGIDTSQFALPLGNLLVTGGVGPHQGMAIWAHQAAPDTRGPSVGFHIPQAGRTHYPVDLPISLLIHETLETPTIVNGTTFIVRPLGGAAIDGTITFAFDDVLTFAPDAPLAANTTYEVVLPDGGILDAAGNGIVGYSFTFSTGASVGGNAAPAVDTFTASAHPVAPAASVTLAATVSDPDGDTLGSGLEVRFDFGDGSAKTAWSSSGSAPHAYAAAGHYQATVQVRDPQGSIASAQHTVTVTTAPAGPLPTHSAPIDCDDASRAVWSVNPDNDSLTLADADALSRDLVAATCADPRSVARAGSELWVTCHDDDQVQVLDAASGAPLQTLDLGYGAAPHGVAISPDGATAFVALHGAGELRRFSTATRSQTGSVALGPGPRALAISGEGGDVYVSRFLSPRNHAEIWEVDAASMSLVRTLRVGKFGGDENRDGTASGRGVLNFLAGLALSPDGQTLWVAGNKANTDRGLLFTPTADPIDLDSDNTVRNVVVAIDLASGAVDEAIDIDNSDSAVALAFSPLGDYLFVALQGNDEVLVLDALRIGAGTSGLGSLVTRLGVGAAPQGLCVDPSTERVFVEDFLGRTVTALETTDLFAAGSKSITSSTIQATTTEALAADVLAGKRIFYGASDPRMSAEGYLSCATCHVDGGHDGRVWDFTGRGEGLRNTTSLRGRGGTAHGNVHWSGNFDEIQDFEHDMRGPFGGSGFLTAGDFAATNTPLGGAKAGLDADLDALAAYVASLGDDTLPRSPYRQPDGALTADAVAGRQVFAGLGCGSCHGGTTFTDSTVGTTLGQLALHDVGTLRTTSGQRLGATLPGIDTPTLRGLWNTAPYFHDGSAPEVEDVFAVAGGTLLEAESGTPSGGASIATQYVDLNNDDTVYDRSFAHLGGGATLTLTGVDGGPSGVGALEMRYSSSYDGSFQLRVNGALIDTVVPGDSGNDPQWRQTYWQTLRFEGIPWTAGASNSVQIVTPSGAYLGVDAFVVSTADDLAAAAPHRAAASLSASERDALVAYLLQLDGSTEDNPGDVLFADGFESGDVTIWSSNQP